MGLVVSGAVSQYQMVLVIILQEKFKYSAMLEKEQNQGHFVVLLVLLLFVGMEREWFRNKGTFAMLKVDIMALRI